MIKVTIEGMGTFQINEAHIQELVAWLSNKQAIALKEKNTVRETTGERYTGRELINE